MSNPFQIGLVAGKEACVNGTVKAQVVLSVGNEQKLAETVRLDSANAVNRTAKAWAELFSLDRQQVVADLNRLSVSVVAKSAQRQERLREQIDSAGRVSELANQFICTEIEPEWHAGGKTLFSARLNREIPIASLWTVASDAWIDQVGQTREGLESPMGFRGRLGIFRDALAMAAGRMISSLPEHLEVERDKTVKTDELQSELVAWLLKERQFRLDNGNPTSTTYFRWASGVTAGAWCQCYTAPVFARLACAGAPPEIAVKGEMLRQELRRPSHNKLAAELRSAGLADTDYVVKVTAKSWRVWLLDPSVIGSVATPEGAEVDS